MVALERAFGVGIVLVLVLEQLARLPMIHRVRELISLIGPISPIRVVAPTIRARGRYGPNAQSSASGLRWWRHAWADQYRGVG
jgi:hypothetical protein